MSNIWEHGCQLGRERDSNIIFSLASHPSQRQLLVNSILKEYVKVFYCTDPCTRLSLESNSVQVWIEVGTPPPPNEKVLILRRPKTITNNNILIYVRFLPIQVKFLGDPSWGHSSLIQDAHDVTC